MTGTATSRGTTAIRPFDAATDRDAARRIWTDCGWIDGSDKETKAIDAFADCDEAWVATVDGTPEAFVTGHMGDIEYAGQRLPAGIISSVTASLTVRRSGLAGRLTAHVLARLAERGSAVGALGVFDHGYYDKLGYGAGAYDHFAWIDPDRLQVPMPSRPPVRLGTSDEDVAEVHAGRLRRLRLHGAVSVTRPGHTRESMCFPDGGMGFGFRDPDDGRLTHHIWIERKDPEVGPWIIKHHAFETWEQYLELLGLLRSFGDQVRLVRLYEPEGVQLQTMVSRPFRNLGKTKGGALAERVEAFDWTMFRIDDLQAAMRAASAASRTPLAFNLRLEDPVLRRLGDDLAWRGVGGDWTARLTGDATGGVAVGHDDDLPLLETSVGAFTQWWLGVQPASWLSARGEFVAPPELVMAMDAALQLPRPCADWNF